MNGRLKRRADQGRCIRATVPPLGGALAACGVALRSTAPNRGWITMFAHLPIGLGQG
jgi:hypothetical protein